MAQFNAIRYILTCIITRCCCRCCCCHLPGRPFVNGLSLVSVHQVYGSAVYTLAAHFAVHGVGGLSAQRNIAHGGLEVAARVPPIPVLHCAELYCTACTVQQCTALHLHCDAHGWPVHLHCAAPQAVVIYFAANISGGHMNPVSQHRAPEIEFMNFK